MWGGVERGGGWWYPVRVLASRIVGAEERPRALLSLSSCRLLLAFLYPIKLSKFVRGEAGALYIP